MHEPPTNDPISVLAAVRAASDRAEATEELLADPAAPALKISVPFGVVHPLHVGWIAELLEVGEGDVEALLHPDPDDDGPGLLERLARSTGPRADALAQQGFKPTDLVLRCIPVAPGAQRPDPNPAVGHPVRSLLNRWLSSIVVDIAAIEQIHSTCSVDAWSRGSAFQNRMRSYFEGAATSGLSFHPAVAPSEHRRSSEGWDDPERWPHSWKTLFATPEPQYFADPPDLVMGVALARSYAVVEFAYARAVVDLRTGDFRVEPRGPVAIEAAYGDRLILQRGTYSELFGATYDLSTGDSRPRVDADLPSVFVGSACCGLDLVDLRTGGVCNVPGPTGSDHHGVTMSGCGRYAWLELKPEFDPLGIVSVQTGQGVFQPWPHPEVSCGSPEVEEDVEEEEDPHDIVTRALGRTPDGRFRWLYGGKLFQDMEVVGQLDEPRHARFDATASRLSAIEGDDLVVLRLGDDGAVRDGQRWSLTPIRQHVTLDVGDAELVNVVMSVFGTVDELARLGSEAQLKRQVEERSFDELGDTTDLWSAIEAAKAADRPRRVVAR